MIRELKAWLTIFKGLLQGKTLGDITYDQEGEAAKMRIMRTGK